MLTFIKICFDSHAIRFSGQCPHALRVKDVNKYTDCVVASPG